MSKKFLPTIPFDKPTDPKIFFDRRKFLAGAVGGAAIATLPSSLWATTKEEILAPPISRPEIFPAKRNEAFKIPEGLRQPLSSRLSAGTHNNFYEFLPTGAGPVWQRTEKFEVEPWKVEVTGLCNKPRTYDLDDLLAFPQEERLYHFRCVERWAMNVPWTGFPISKLLKQVEPQSDAKFVRFTTANRPDQMPGIAESNWYPWPYIEGLRLDEAMNPLALFVTGVYGEPLLKQHGAPIRVIVPWKYGYKNPKSIVKIELVSSQPKTFWQVQPHEYGFLSNVNPNIPHPRWSQERSYWLDGQQWFSTPMFNGYAEHVASLYPDAPTTPQRPLRQGQIAR